MEVTSDLIDKLLKFCIVGTSGVILDFGVTYICKEWFRVNKYLSNSIGFVLSTTSNYIFNRNWTFHSSNPDVTMQYVKFMCIAAVGLLLSNTIIYLLNDRMKLNFYISKVISLIAIMSWNFLMNYLFTFAA